MKTIKSYATIEQSRKLAEILPLESADMYYHYNEYEERHYPKVFLDYQTAEIRQEVLELKRNDPCWSLSALLNVLPDKLQIVLAINDFQGDGKKKYAIGSVEHDKYDCYADNPIDACIAMIEKLHELKML